MKKKILSLILLILINFVYCRELSLVLKPEEDYYSFLKQEYNISNQNFDRINTYVKDKSKKYNLDSNIVLAIIAVESNFKPNAKSYLGEYYGKGLMQVSTIVLTEYNWMHYKEKEHFPYELYNIEFNIEVGCWMLARLRDHYKIDCSDLGNWLSAYNAGTNGGYQKSYVMKIQTVLDRSS